MAYDRDVFPPFEPELLIATFQPNGEIGYRNEAWADTLGSRGAWSRLASDDQERARHLVQEASSGSLVTNQLFGIRCRGEEDELPLLLSFLPVVLPSEGTRRVEAVMVTGEVLREPETWTMSQTQRNRLENLGRMTMGIAHDFNNLLSGILGYTELLKSYAVEERLDASVGQNLRTIEQAALDGAALIRKIQHYIRQEKQTHFEPLDLPTLIQDCITLTRPYWYNEPRRQGISIDTVTHFEDVPPVNGSGTELREVFINLILNAVQAMPDGGVLTFRTTRLPEGHILAQVSDTGMGMSDHVRERIFEPLFTTKGDRGTGMGLAITYGIIQEHDGTVTVHSELGQGTRFDLTFPPATAHAPQAQEIPEQPPSTRARLLIVDDETMVRTILAKLLTMKGHEVTQAASGAEALAIAEERTFDLVFTDHGMPEMNGRQFARRLRSRHPSLPIILLTGDTEVGEAGDDVNVVLSKPFKIDELEATIQKILG